MFPESRKSSRQLATKKMSTPIITVELEDPLDEKIAKMVQSSAEITPSGKLCSYIDAEITFNQGFW